jgi:hypothetical protein
VDKLGDAAADSPGPFLDDGPTSKLIRQILGAVSEFDKAMTVAKLKGARPALFSFGHGFHALIRSPFF